MSFQWYVIQALSGKEKKIATHIMEQVAKKKLEHLFEQVIVPCEEVHSVKHGKKVASEKIVFPGYVFVRMEMNDDALHLIKMSSSNIKGFLGNSGKPMPMSDAEVQDVLGRIAEGTKNKSDVVKFDIGDIVTVSDGPFEGFTGEVVGVDQDKKRVKVTISIFGRATAIDLEYLQISKK